MPPQVANFLQNEQDEQNEQNISTMVEIPNLQNVDPINADHDGEEISYPSITGITVEQIQAAMQLHGFQLIASGSLGNVNLQQNGG